MTEFKPVALCILDGWGLRESNEGNAVAIAETPNFDRIWAECPAATLKAHGEAVGLPEGYIGNSEVGHIHIGAGRTILMEMQRINRAIEDGSFASEPAIAEFITAMQETKGSAHLIGIVSSSGVHGLATHLVESARLLCSSAVPVLIHAIADGRDAPPRDAARHIEQLEALLPEAACIATVNGRYYAMDRDRRWERVEMAWQAIVLGNGGRAATPSEAVQAAAVRGETDEFILPTAVGEYRGIAGGDGVFVTNFRSDRARQIAAAIAEPGFHEFDISGRPELSGMLGMVDYFADKKGWIGAVFGKRTIANTLGSWVAAHGKRQFRLAETEKYPHVTFFLNGGKEEREVGEDRHMPQSPKVATYDLQPEMSAVEVTARFERAVDSGYDLIVVNFANPDMVGHTGNINAAVAACEAVDRGLGRALAAMDRAGGAMIVTADHGNCEQMLDPETGGPHTAHTTNPVPVILVGGPRGRRLAHGKLTDLAPTLLELMNLPPPPEMSGRSLIRRLAEAGNGTAGQ